MPSTTLSRWRAALGLGGPRPKPAVFHDATYWYPVSGLQQPTGVDPRRADLALWYLVEKRILAAEDVIAPAPVAYSDLARVHEAAYLESLLRPEVLARIFAVDASDIPVDELMRTLRVACGGTVEAARRVLRDGGAALNTLGGFHHAARASGGGFCAVNDVAVALAVARGEGFDGQAVVIDLDAHPPDGTADCLAGDRRAWIGSLSAADWGPLPGVDETVLPPGAADDVYLTSLDALLGRMPRPALAFVNAGGDVLAGDRLGRLGLTLEGARQRDIKVRDALAGVPSVWLPSGGYAGESWKVLAGTGLVLCGRDERRISERSDPLRARFTHVSRDLDPTRLSQSELISTEELEEALHVPHVRQERCLGYYTREGLEYALSRFGVWEQIQRLGYSGLRLELGRGTDGERIRIFGSAAGQEHVLVDLVLDRKHVGNGEYLYVNWLALRNPRARFSPTRPPLPGQDVPGLGLAREVGEMLGLMSQRLGLEGVAFRPSWYHMAYAARHRFRFNDAERQQRFQALMAKLQGVPLLEATQMVAEGKVELEGRPYTWEADEMVQARSSRAHAESDKTR
jgi:acetoin utilization deacetylase AcuC-like enzyme